MERSRKKRIIQKNLRGFTLFEIALVLALAGVIMGAIWIAFNSVSESNKINAAVKELRDISQSMVSLYQGRPTIPATGCDTKYPASISSAVVSAGIVPQNWVVANGAGCQGIAHPWSPGPASALGGVGNFFVWGSGLTGSTNKFRLSFYNIPLDACVALILQMTNCDPSQSTCPQDVFTNFDVPGPPTVFAAGPPKSWQNMTVAKASVLCGFNSLPPYTTGNSLEFDFTM